MSTCPRPDKIRYESRAAVIGAIRRLPKRRKSMGLHPYRCTGCGGRHAGRSIRRARIAWRAEP